MTDVNQNILSLSLPTNLLTGGAANGGLNLSYNFGQNVEGASKNAYDFLSQTFAGSTAFEGHAIQSTQDFLTAQTTPILTSVAGEADTYFSQIMGAFNTTLDTQKQISSQSIAAEQDISQRSISSSNKSRKGGSLLGSLFGGGCFISTAVCKYSGLADDCELLETLRAWRDDYLLSTPEGTAMVEHYYKVAPGYVAAIGAKDEATQMQIWRELFRLIATAAHHIRVRDHAITLAYYMAAVEFARVSSESAP